MKKLIIVKSEVISEVKQFLEDCGINYEIAETPGKIDNAYFVVSTRGYDKYDKLSRNEFWDDVGNPYKDFHEYLEFVERRNWRRTPQKNFSDLEKFRLNGRLSRTLEYILIRNNVTSEELLHMTDEEISSLRGVGKKRMQELAEFIAYLAWKKFN